jgi:hypothetical protein
MLQRAERAVARAHALAHRLPGVSDEVLERTLLAAAEDEAARDAAAAAAAERAEDGTSSVAPRAPPRVIEKCIETHERDAVRAPMPAGSAAAAHEAATQTELVLRCGGDGRERSRMHAVASPCYIRVSSAIACGGEEGSGSPTTTTTEEGGGGGEA